MVLDRSCNDVDNATSTTRAELDCACVQCEQRVILATADAYAGVEVCAALANDDFASLDNLTAEALYTQVLSVGVTAVASGTRTLFMCHLKMPAFLLKDSKLIELLIAY
ncbi:hypothetical protein ART_1042 [Arthrobacter sp. PAMC 25486]|nr:hypothetical protein ART_1042 [Arthrobacter sp. PAMC 25486]